MLRAQAPRRLLCLARTQTTLSAQEVDNVARQEVKFPLYLFLRDMQREQNAKFDAQNAKFDAQNAKFDAQNAKFESLSKDISRLSERITSLPPLVVGAVVGGMTLGQLVGYRLRIHSDPA